MGQTAPGHGTVAVRYEAGDLLCAALEGWWPPGAAFPTAPRLYGEPYEVQIGDQAITLTASPEFPGGVLGFAALDRRRGEQWLTFQGVDHNCPAGEATIEVVLDEPAGPAEPILSRRDPGT